MTDTAVPAPARKPSRAKTIVVGVVCMIVGLVIGYNLGQQPTQSIPTPDAAQQQSDGGAQPATATAPASPPAQPQVLLDVSGSGANSTQKFTAAGDWDLQYDYSCQGMGGTGNMIVGVMNADGSPSQNNGVNELGAGRSDVTHFHVPGTFYLEVNSECSWHVKVIG